MRKVYYEVRPAALSGFCTLTGRTLIKRAQSGELVEGGFAHAFLLAPPECVAPRYLIWTARPGDYWNHRPDQRGLVHGVRVVGKE